MEPTLISVTRALSRELAAEKNWHDLALLSVAQDSVLRAEDLLSLTVANVTYSTGEIRDYLGKAQDKIGHGVFPPLGIMDAGGRIDLEVLSAFGAYCREHWLSAPDYVSVKGHLEGVFPDRVPGGDGLLE